MIRLIVRTVNIGAAVNIGGPVDTSFKTFVIDNQEIENYLRKWNGQYMTTEIVGAEQKEDDTSRIQKLVDRYLERKKGD